MADVSRRWQWLGTVVVAWLLAAAQGGVAATVAWNVGSGTWDNTTTGNWSPVQVPVNNDAVNLTVSGAVPVAITYAATNLTTGLNSLTLGNAGGGPTSLYLDGTDVLSAVRLFLNPGGVINQTGGTLSHTSGTDDCTIAGGSYAISGGTFSVQRSLVLNSGSIVQTGGTISMVQYDTKLYGGSYSLDGSAAAAQLTTRELHVIPSSGSATLTLGAGATITTSGTATSDFTVGAAGGGTFIMNGGTFSSGSGNSHVAANGLVRMNAGTWTERHYIVNGTFELNGGTFDPSFDLTVGTTVGSAGTARIAGGQALLRSLWLGADYNGNLGGQGTVEHTGGTIQLGPSGALTVSHASATVPSSYTLRGGTLTQASATNATVHPLGTFRGQGTPALTGTLTNNGKVIAEDFGGGAVLDLSNFGSVANTVDNTSDKGWYALGGGKLVLKSLTVPAGASTLYWGDTAGTTALPDLVNSVKLTFTGVQTGGTLAMSLLGSGRADAHAGAAVNDPADPGVYQLVGAWDFSPSGLAFGAGTVALTFRYDEALAVAAAAAMARGEGDLRLLHYNGLSWDPVAATLDTAGNRITASGLNSFSVYAVAMLPEPGAAVLLAAAAAAACGGRRGRREKTWPVDRQAAGEARR